MAVEVKPTGEHGKKKWCVVRNGVVVPPVHDSNSQACIAAAGLAEAEEDAQKVGEKKGAAAEKKKAVAPPQSSEVKPIPRRVTKKVGKKR